MQFKNNYSNNDTIIALSTNIHKSSIAIIKISGINSINIVNSIFTGYNLNTLKSCSIKYGKIIYENNFLDDVIISVFISPKSYTGENVVEISCHASIYIVNTIFKLCIDMGARIANPGEFTMRAFINNKMDLIQAESIIDVIASTSKKAHLLATNQMQGNISNKLKYLRKKLIDVSAILEIDLDFSEENIKTESKTILKDKLQNINKIIFDLINTFLIGNTIKNGVNVTIIGNTNTGKSTLINQITQNNCSIVSDIKGTTRDIIKNEHIIDDIKFIFSDTAGIRDTKDTLELEGIRRTYYEIKKSHIIIYLFDPLNNNINNIRNNLNKITYRCSKYCHIITVANKIDYYDIEKITNEYKSINNFLCISAKNNFNIDILKKMLTKIFYVDNITYENNIIISNNRHYDILKKSYNILNKAIKMINLKGNDELIAYEINEAIYYLGTITGEIYTEDKLNYIFSNFCIGK